MLDRKTLYLHWRFCIMAPREQDRPPRSVSRLGRSSLATVRQAVAGVDKNGDVEDSTMVM